MSQRRAESVVEHLIRASPLNRFVQPERGVRFLEFCAVGSVGMVIDLLVTFSLLGHVHYLLANLVGFLAAVSFNFVGNWIVTYNRPDGDLSWQYLSYVVLHAGTFAFRALALALLIEAVGMPKAPATAAGIVVAAILNFIGTETIFEGVGEVWFNATEAANHIAHVVYSSRMRHWLLWTGLYNRVFDLYARGLALVYRQDSRLITVGSATAAIATEQPTETVSVLHTLEKEQSVLESFISDVRPSDHVLDVGANVGVYACLAGSICERVTAVEAHEPTASRCEANLKRNDVAGNVVPAALGDTEQAVSLAITNDAVGTQRPAVAGDGDDSRLIPQYQGDSLPGDPDVIKIDVEGAECEVLDGLSETLRRCRVVYVEAHSEAEATALRGMLQAAAFDVETVHEGEQIYLRAARESDRNDTGGEQR